MSATNPVHRRDFIASAAGLGLLILKPETVRAYQANSVVRMGLLGCGSRGTSVGKSFMKNTGARYVALADIFPDQIEVAKATFTDATRTFRGAHAYQELAASKEVDAIQISTPPFFHVEHLAAAIAGGKHVYCEKPVGVDVAQAKRALELAKTVKGRVSVDVGFQIRSAPPFVELVKRLHGGDIGKFVSIAAHYYAPAARYPDRPASMTPNELRLRNWNWDLTLSGDIIVEQDIHVVDICNWILKSRPVAAYATGGRNVLQHPGDNFDNYEIDYTYPDDVHVSLTAKQYGETTDFDVSELVFGSEGTAESPYSGPLRITGPRAWQWQQPADAEEGHSSGFAANGSFSDNLAQADSEKDKAFIASIVSGNHHNQIETGVETALSAILARMSARRKRFLTWDEMLATNEDWKLDVDLGPFT
jgi:predicted dehydrogenase